MTTKLLTIAAAGLIFLGAGGIAQAVVVRTAVAVHPRPVARAAAVTTTAVVTAAAVGAVVHSVPSGCSSVMVGNVAYQQCGSTWYQPRYAGSGVDYVVVNPPR